MEPNDEHPSAFNRGMTLLGKILILVAGFLVASLPMTIVVLTGYIKGNSGFWIGLIALLIFAVIFVYLGRKMQLWTHEGYSDLGETKPLATSIGIAVAIAVASRIFVMVVTLMSNAGTTANDQGIQTIAQSSSIYLLVLAVTLVAPLVEEIIFRGVVFKLFFRERPQFAMILSTVIFAAAHTPTDLYSALMYGTLGLSFSFIYYYTRRIEMSMLAHFLNNFLPGIALLLMHWMPELIK